MARLFRPYLLSLLHQAISKVWARVAFSVALAHVALIYLLTLSSNTAPIKPTPLQVKIVKLTPSTKITDSYFLPKLQKASQKPLKEKAEKKVESDLQSQSHTKKRVVQVKKEPSRKKSEKPKEKVKGREEKLSKPEVDHDKLKKALEALNNVKTSPYGKANDATKNITLRKNDNLAGKGQESITYEMAIASFLRQWLKLPEYGSVKVSLTLSPDGKVVKLRTLTSESELNRHFVEERIPRLIFPVAGNNLAKQSNKTLTLVLQNE